MRAPNFNYASQIWFRFFWRFLENRSKYFHTILRNRQFALNSTPGRHARNGRGTPQLGSELTLDMEFKVYLGASKCVPCTILGTQS